MEADEFFYRAEVRQYCGCGITEWGVEDYYVTAPRVEVCKYRVIKRTPKGAWIEEGIGGKRFVLLTARKRFACPTEAEALESLVARKQAHLRHERKRLASVKSHLQAAVVALGKLQHERNTA